MSGKIHTPRRSPNRLEAAVGLFVLGVSALMSGMAMAAGAPLLSMAIVGVGIPGGLVILADAGYTGRAGDREVSSS